MKEVFNPDIQYRCTIIRGKAQKELDNLLPAYANIVSEICPCTKDVFDQEFNDRLSEIIYDDTFDNLGAKCLCTFSEYKVNPTESCCVIIK